MEMNVNSLGYLSIIRNVIIHMNDSADNHTIGMNDLPDSFNLKNNLLVPTHNDTITMNDLLESFIFMNNVLVPTHRLQNMLDIVLTCKA